MVRLRILSILAVVASIAAVCASVEAQKPVVAIEAPPTVTESHPVERPMPFAPTPHDKSQVIEYRSAEEMTEPDKELARSAESSIGEHAGFVGLEFDQGNNRGKWSYQQVVCPALANHLFLQFTRNNGVGDVSMFSASIPRSGDGRVRIIPILRRGYSFWSPAPVNALTISTFNHIRDEEHADHVSDWLGVGLCYASLTAGHRAVAFAEEEEAGLKYPTAMTPSIEISTLGGATMSFTDVWAAEHPMEWEMEFDGKGKLLKAMHKSEPVATFTKVPEPTQDAPGKPIPETGLDVAKPVSETGLDLNPKQSQ
ncbi:MAG: hypothetical protein ABSD67_05515 [Terracidiphilus sp.]